MKFTDLINESREERMTSKAKIVFKTFKKGTIGSKDNPNEPMFNYELADDMGITIDDNNRIHIFTSEIKIKELNRVCGLVSVVSMGRKIKKIFQKFNIELSYYQVDLDPYDRRDDLNESLSGFIDTFTPEQKERLYKKAKTIFKVFKRGKITRSDGVSFSYELGDFMRPRIDDEGDLELFASVETITELTFCPINQGWMTELIEQKFKKMFGIKIELTPPHESNLIKWTGKKPWDKEEPTELNEDTDLDKEKKRVKTVHKAIRKGVVTVEGYRFRYELPEDYSFYKVHDELQLTSIQFTFNNKDISGENGGVGLPLKVWRIEEGKDVFVNERLSKEDVSNIVYGDDYLLNTRSGVDFTNVKWKVRNKYRDFNINIITTTPSSKAIMTIYEEVEVLNPTDLTDKEIKKVKLLYKTLKKGIFRYDNLSLYGYVLPDDYYIYKDELGDTCIKLTGEEDSDKLYMFGRIKFSDGGNYDKQLEPHHEGLRTWVRTKIKEKFEGFNIKFIF